MRSHFALVTALTAIAGVNADLCAVGASEIGGNWYCQAVSAITYTGLGGTGSYKRVTNMDSTTGACSSESKSYAGSLAPLDEDVSLHFRGPVAIKQFAVYYPAVVSSSTSSKAATATGNSLGLKRSNKRTPAVERRHAHNNHAHFHENNKEIRELQDAEVEKRAVGDVVSGVMNGKLVSWGNRYDGSARTWGGAASSTAQAVSSSSTAAAAVVASSSVAVVAASSSAAAKVSSSSAQAAASSSSASSSTKAASSSSAAASSSSSVAASSSVVAASSSTAAGAGMPLASGSWARAGYYNAAQRVSQGVAFLNNLGGGASGTFDYKFGNSLSYASADGKASAGSSTILSDVILPSNTEVIIMADAVCTEASCGYYRNGTVAHRGFGGAQKLFLFEFSMPYDGVRTGMSADMPAIWMLNAQIPRTAQYGPAECNCWTTGCGEFDLFEVLDSGNHRCKSTVHGNISGGNSDYFNRPATGTIKAAVLMMNNKAHIQILGNDFSFQDVLTADIVNAIVSTTSTQTASNGVSLFALA